MTLSTNQPQRGWQNGLFYLLFVLLLGMLAWFSTQHRWQWDLSRDGRNSLSQTSIELLQTLPESVQVTVYLPPDELTRQAIKDLIGRYQHLKPDISLTFINPETSPALARELGIAQGGELFIDYQQRQQRLQQLDERSFSNALLRLARPEQRWLVFIEGHGERDPLGKANFDYFELSRRLQARGFQVQRLNLISQPRIPDNSDLVVLASPQSAYLPGEVALLQAYLQQGGNLLWLSEPNSDDGLQKLATELDLERLPGVIVDASAQLFGIDSPDFALVSEYGEHAITKGLQALSLFPQAQALQAKNPSGWQVETLLQTLPRSWTELSPIEGEIGFDADSEERAGPLSLGLVLQRPLPNQRQQQRVVVIGDGDFLANQYLGNGGNLELGARIFSWLTEEDDLLQISMPRAADAQLQLSPLQIGLIGFGFLILLPAGLLLMGFMIVWRRRQAGR